MEEVTTELCCFLYWKYYQKASKGVNIRMFKNFDKQREDVKKWVCFEKLSEIINQYHIDPYKYISSVIAQYNGNFVHPKQLINPKNLRMWNDRNKHIKELKQYNDITKYFNNSLAFIIRFCIKNNIHSFEKYLNATIRAEVLGMHIATGRISKYYLCLLPITYLEQIKKHIEPDIAHQLHNMVIKNKEALSINTQTAFREINSIELGSILEITNNNIKKNIDKSLKNRVLHV